MVYTLYLYILLIFFSSLGADNIDTPHHLSWLCYQEIHRHRPDQLVVSFLSYIAVHSGN